MPSVIIQPIILILKYVLFIFVKLFYTKQKTIYMNRKGTNYFCQLNIAWISGLLLKKFNIWLQTQVLSKKIYMNNLSLTSNNKLSIVTIQAVHR
jgi:hypothetical protein